MSVQPDDLFELVDKIRYDLTAAQGKITDLKTMLGELTQSLPARGAGFECPHCHVVHRTEQRLSDHLELIHPLGADTPAPIEKTRAKEPK